MYGMDGAEQRGQLRFWCSALGSLPEGSGIQMIEGGSHIMMYEKNCYHTLQNGIISFLKKPL